MASRPLSSGLVEHAPAQEPWIEARELCRHFHRGTPAEVRAVEHLSLAIPRGSFTVLKGPSGSGKTTLLCLLGLLDRPSSGTLRLGDAELSGASDYELARQRRRMGFVFQDFALLPNLRVSDNIGYALVPRGWTRKQRAAAGERWLTRLGLAHRMASSVRELSGGERQRVAIARALAGDPEIVLADEPTSNLDEASACDVAVLLRELHEAGRTLIVATHDHALWPLATHTFHLKEGRLV